MARLKVTIATNKVNSKQVGYIDIDPDELEMLKEDEEALGELATEKMWEMLNLEYEIEE